MKVLVTAGSTIVRIDKVRAITNIFKGRTGTLIAQYFARQGADVTLLTSNRELMNKYRGPKIKIVDYKDYNDLFSEMELLIASRDFDIVIHSAAVSDYEASGAYIKNKNGRMVKLNSGKKISSKHKELFLRLTPTDKIIDCIKKEWNFGGVLVKFKLEVGLSDDELIEIATESMKFSNADLIVANCLEWSSDYAYIIDGNNNPQKIKRVNLPRSLYGSVEGML